MLEYFLQVYLLLAPNPHFSIHLYLPSVGGSNQATQNLTLTIGPPWSLRSLLATLSNPSWHPSLRLCMSSNPLPTRLLLVEHASSKKHLFSTAWLDRSGQTYQNYGRLGLAYWQTETGLNLMHEYLYVGYLGARRAQELVWRVSGYLPST